MGAGEYVDGERVLRLRVQYRHSAMGRALLEAGHVTGSREYAVGIDPFTWPRELRGAAYAGRGAELDDKAAYPRAMAALTGGLGPASKKFLSEEIDADGKRYLLRDEILLACGRYLWPVDAPASRAREARPCEDGHRGVFKF